MTDEAWEGPACETCKGKGETVFARGNYWSSVRCDDCRGTGLTDTPPPGPLYVEREYNPEVHGPLPPPGDHSAVREAGVCGACLGQGVVTVNLVERPCPVCST